MAFLLQATRRPPLLDLSRLEELPFISSEILSSEASRWATALHSAGAFDEIFLGADDWTLSANSWSSQAAHPDHLFLREDSFTETEAWDDQAGPNELT